MYRHIRIVGLVPLRGVFPTQGSCVHVKDPFLDVPNGVRPDLVDDLFDSPLTLFLPRPGQVQFPYEGLVFEGRGNTFNDYLLDGSSVVPHCTDVAFDGDRRELRRWVEHPRALPQKDEEGRGNAGGE